jgi:hypothetical protein
VKTASSFVVVTTLIACVSLAGCGSPDRAPVWDYISPVIMEPNCASASCHSPGVAAAGLDFSNPDVGYSSLTRLWVWIVDRNKAGQPGCGPRDGTIVCEQQFRPLVTPYDPAQSRLINLLRARDAPRMPPDRPLDEADIELIENWILAGAKRHGGDSAPPADASADAPAATDAADAAPTDAPNDDAADAASDASDGGTEGGQTDASTDGVAG